MERLRQEYATRNEMSRFTVLQLFVGVGEDKTPPSYVETGQISGVTLLQRIFFGLEFLSDR